MRRFACALLGLLTAGCDDPPKTRRDEPPVHFYSDAWRELKTNLHDGAVRVGAHTFQEGRRVTVRCFGASSGDARTLDIRYTIEVPLLRRLEKELKEKGGITLNVSADDNTSRVLKALVGVSSDGLFFLADADRELVESLANAKKKIFVVPVMGGEKIDGVLEFGAGHAKVHIDKVLEACRTETPAPNPSQASLGARPGRG